MSHSKCYIAVLEEVPDHMVPVLVAHSMLGAHLATGLWCVPTDYDRLYCDWLANSFRKCVVRVNRKEFEKIKELPDVYLGHENTTLNGEKSCAVLVVNNDEIPNVLKWAKLWKPNSLVRAWDEYEQSV